MNIDGITITVDRDTLKVTLARWGRRVVIRFVEINHCSNGCIWWARSNPTIRMAFPFLSWRNSLRIT